MKKYQRFLSENFPFLEVKFSIYLNRHVFVMCTKAVCIVCSETVYMSTSIERCKYVIIALVKKYNGS